MKANVSSLKLIKLLVTSLDKPRSQSELTAVSGSYFRNLFHNCFDNFSSFLVFQLAVNFSVHEDRFLVRLLVASIDLSVEKSVDPKVNFARTLTLL